MVNEEDRYEFDEMLEIYMKIVIFDGDKKDTLNLCFRAVFAGIKKVLVIFRRKRQLLNIRRLIKS